MVSQKCCTELLNGLPILWSQYFFSWFFFMTIMVCGNYGHKYFSSPKNVSHHIWSRKNVVQNC
jgi:hypothetical protein